jgi:hypothetical protein
MGKHLSTFYKDDKSEYCEIHIDFKEELLYIKYYKKDAHKWFHMEEFPGKAHRYVEDVAENWALGLKKIDPQYAGPLL